MNLRQVILYCFLLSWLSGCTNLFYYPTREHVLGPGALGLEHTEISIGGDGPQLNGWYLHAEGNPLGTVFFLHGNAENISTHIGAVHWLPAAGYNVFLFDYRGYGKSAGIVEIDGVHEDVKRALAYLRCHYADSQPRFLFGQSLGASMALYLAGDEDFKESFQAVIAESPFSGYRKIVRDKLAEYWLTIPFGWLIATGVSDEFSPLKKVSSISPLPVLIIHGEADEVVPVEHGIKLYEQAKEPKELWLVPNGAHTAAFSQRSYREKLLQYFEKVLSNRTN